METLAVVRTGAGARAGELVVVATIYCMDLFFVSRIGAIVPDTAAVTSWQSDGHRQMQIRHWADVVVGGRW